MKKKASLTLSINAIVVLILAITMLGLGLSFMRNIFGGATEEFTKVSGTVEKQMIDQMKQSGKPIDLSRPKVNIRIGDDDQIYIGLRNDQQDVQPYTITQVECDSLGGAGGLNCDAGGDVSIEWLERPMDIEGGETRVMPINIKVKTTANEGTCFCTIAVESGGATKKTELTIDVIV